MKKAIIALMTAGMLMTAAPAFAAVPAEPTAVPAEPNGCHGALTVQFKNAEGDAGAQGTAIGGKGNSDGTAANGQAHSDPGRGEQLQAVLGALCGVGSQKP